MEAATPTISRPLWPLALALWLGGDAAAAPEGPAAKPGGFAPPAGEALARPPPPAAADAGTRRTERTARRG